MRTRRQEDGGPERWRSLPEAPALGSGAFSAGLVALLGRKEEDPVQWVKTTVPESFFHDSNADAVSSAYADIMLWVQRNLQARPGVQL